MKCPNCGYELEKPNLKNCPVCGHKIKRDRDVGTPVATTSPLVSSTIESDVYTSEHPRTPEQVIHPVMVECPLCRTLIPEENNFCPRCGYNMRQHEDSELQEEIATETPSIDDSPLTFGEQMEWNNEPQTDDEEDAEEEKQPAMPLPDNRRDENLEEYIDNGSYQPDQEEEEILDSTSQVEEAPASTSWITIILAAIISVLFGALLYILFQ